MPSPPGSPCTNKPIKGTVKKLTVGADAHIGPFENVANFPKNAHFCGFFHWGDVGIAPYDYESWTTLTRKSAVSEETAL